MCEVLLEVGGAGPTLPASSLSWLRGDRSLSALLCCCRLDWPVRTLSFSHDGKMLASASEDHFIDIAEVETGNGLLLGNGTEGIGWRSAGGAGRALEELGCAQQSARRGSLCLANPS